MVDSGWLAESSCAIAPDKQETTSLDCLLLSILLFDCWSSCLSRQAMHPDSLEANHRTRCANHRTRCDNNHTRCYPPYALPPYAQSRQVMHPDSPEDRFLSKPSCIIFSNAYLHYIFPDSWPNSLPPQTMPYASLEDRFS